MFRPIGIAVKGLQIISSNVLSPAFYVKNAAAQSRLLSSVYFQRDFPSIADRLKCSTLFSEPTIRPLLPITQNASVPIIPKRTVIKFGFKRGKRKSVKAVLSRFYRLNWGMWIRTIAGRSKHKWRKTERRKSRNKQHVFCNAQQCNQLDRMVTKYWKRPRYYVDDPYAPYQTREEFSITRRKPFP